MDIKTDRLDFTTAVLFKDGLKSIVSCSLIFEKGEHSVPYFRNIILN